MRHARKEVPDTWPPYISRQMVLHASRDRTTITITVYVAAAKATFVLGRTRVQLQVAVP